MHHFLNCLLELEHDVKHITIETHKHPFEIEEYPKEIRIKTNPEAIFVNTKINPAHALTHLFSSKSYNIHRFYNTEFEQKLTSHFANNQTDIIIIESIYLAEYLPTIKHFSSAKVIVRTHNIEHEIWINKSKTSNNIFKKIYLHKLAKDLKKIELDFLSNVDLIFSISKRDQQLFQTLGCITKNIIIPLTIDIPPISNTYQNHNFFFLGAMNWGPNKEAVHLLSNIIFPNIKKKNASSKLLLAGSYMKTNKPITNGIEYRGYVEDLQAFISESGILLTPIQSGSGVRIKILECMAAGVPIITSPKGIEGIEVEHQKEVLIAKNNFEFVKFAEELINSKEKRKQIGANAQEFIKANHAKQNIVNILNEYIK